MGKNIVAPELVRDFTSMIGPRKPHFVKGFTVSGDEFDTHNSFVITFTLSEEYRKKLHIDFPIFLYELGSKISAWMTDQKEIDEIRDWMKKIHNLKEEMEIYFPIKKLVIEVF